MHNYIRNMSIYTFLFYKIIVYNNNKKQKMIKSMIFMLFLLQKVNFEEIRKYCFYIIMYYQIIIYTLYILYMSNFFFYFF